MMSLPGPSNLKLPATPDDVRAAYRLLLGREAESERAVAHHLNGAPSVGEVVVRIMHSLEYLRRMSARGGVAYGPLDWNDTGVEVAADPAALQRLLAHVTATWTALGEASPHYSVLTNPAYLPAAMDAEREAQFYASAEEEVAMLRRLCHRNGVALAGQSVLDFGCGVGRLGAPLAAIFPRYTGVDVSAPHLGLAAARFAAIGRDAELLPIAAFLAAPGRRWDCIVSILVLQHSPPPVMRWLLRELLDRLAPAGVALIQIPAQLRDYRFSIAHYLADARPGDIEMHALPQRHVFATVAEARCVLLGCMPDGRAGDDGQSCTYVIQRPRGPAA